MFSTPRSRARRRPRLTVALVAPLAALSLSSCAALGVSSGSGTDGGSGASSSADASPVDGRPAVVAAFYPLAWISEQVAGDRASVVNLTTPGGEPHDLEIGVQQTAELADADLVVYERGFQPAVDAAVAEDTGGRTLDVADVVELEPYGGHADEHGDEHGDEQGHEHGDEHGDEHADEHAGETGDGHDHGAGLGDLNPHFWQDPLKMATLADAVAEQLSTLDPAGAGTYARNAAEVRASLEELDSAYSQGLASCTRDVVVVNHDAFGYLDRYGLQFEAITGFTPDAEPTAADLARLQALIADDGITTVFYERLVSPQTARVLAADTGTRAAVLDPIEGLTSETADEGYLSLMRENLRALESANGC